MHPPTIRTRVAQFLRTLTVEWPDAERMVVWLYRRFLRFFFTALGVVVAAFVALVGVAAFVDVLAQRHYHFVNRRLGVAFVVLLILDLSIIFVHELGHAAVLVHYGRRVKSAGFRLYFGTPSFFIESSDGLMLPRGRRILQSFAGPGAELVAAGLASIALWAFPDGPAARALYGFVVINYFVLFLNLVPLLELDGYWILSDALQMPDLRPRSLAFVRHDLWHKLRRRQRLTRNEIGLTLYGTIGVLFTILCLASAWFFWRRVFGNAIGQMWDAGLYGRVLLVLVILLLAGPVLRAHGSPRAGPSGTRLARRVGGVARRGRDVRRPSRRDAQ